MHPTTDRGFRLRGGRKKAIDSGAARWADATLSGFGMIGVRRRTPIIPTVTVSNQLSDPGSAV